MPDKKWLEKEVTISREQMGTVLSKNIVGVKRAMERRSMDKELIAGIEMLLTDFSAQVAAEIFDEEEED